MGKRIKIQGETGFYYFLICLGCIILYISWKYGLGRFDSPGPGLYPFSLGLIILISTIAHLFWGQKPNREPPLNRYGIKQFIFMNLTGVIWIFTLPILGYISGTFIMNYVFCKIMRLEGWLKPLALSAAVTFFIYLLFDYWLYIDLPRGIILGY